MKKDTHPQYHTWTQVVCICGHTHTINAAVAWPIKVESCPNCHPTYTGKEQNCERTYGKIPWEAKENPRSSKESSLSFYVARYSLDLCFHERTNHC